MFASCSGIMTKPRLGHFRKVACALEATFMMVGVALPAQAQSFAPDRFQSWPSVIEQERQPATRPHSYLGPGVEIIDGPTIIDAPADAPLFQQPAGSSGWPVQTQDSSFLDALQSFCWDAITWQGQWLPGFYDPFSAQFAFGAAGTQPYRLGWYSYNDFVLMPDAHTTIGGDLNRTGPSLVETVSATFRSLWPPSIPRGPSSKAPTVTAGSTSTSTRSSRTTA